jgi:hypothetical protein
LISECIKDIDRENYEKCESMMKDGVVEKCYHEELDIAKLILGLKYFFQIIPTAVTLSEGIIVGCLIVQGLLPR